MGAVVKKKSKSRKSIKMRGGANGGTYTFTDDNSENSISFFSDIEGNMPDGIKNLMFDTGYTPKTLGNEVIVFTGDLIDRGEYTIRNLQRMLALKKGNLIMSYSFAVIEMLIKSVCITNAIFKRLKI